MTSPNRGILEAVAWRLEPLLGDLVFVGGQVAELLITDPAAVRVRATTDVDVVVPVTTRAEYRKAERRIEALGFRHDTRVGAPICRWVSPEGHVLDLMPVHHEILGFSNRWYGLALDTARAFVLTKDLTIRIPTAPAFLAMKLEAFHGRGRGDLLRSHDLEDVITVVAGRDSISDEVADAPYTLRSAIAEQFQSLLRESEFLYALEGALPDVARSPGIVEIVLERFATLAVAR